MKVIENLAMNLLSEYITGSSSIWPLCFHSLVRIKNNSYFVGIKPQPREDLCELTKPLEGDGLA